MIGRDKNLDCARRLDYNLSCCFESINGGAIDEENVSAEHALAEENAWVSCENENVGRSSSDCKTARARSQEIDGIKNVRGSLE